MTKGNGTQTASLTATTHHRKRYANPQNACSHMYTGLQRYSHQVHWLYSCWRLPRSSMAVSMVALGLLSAGAHPLSLTAICESSGFSGGSTCIEGQMPLTMYVLLRFLVAHPPSSVPGLNKCLKLESLLLGRKEQAVVPSIAVSFLYRHPPAP